MCVNLIKINAELNKREEMSRYLGYSCLGMEKEKQKIIALLRAML
jgi:hypothetical protein